MSVMSPRVLIMLADASSRQCPRTRGTRVLQCSSASVPLVSLYLRLMPLSVRSALVLAVVMVIMIPSQWLRMPPIKTTVQVIWDKMTGSCHRGRRDGSEIRIGLISPIVFTLLLIHLTDIRALANAQQPCDVRCSPDNNSESYIQYLSHHLSYHKRGVEEGDDSIRY